MLREFCPCDEDGICPYGATSYSHCEYNCGEPDTFDMWEEYSDDEFPYEWMPVDGEE